MFCFVLCSSFKTFPVWFYWPYCVQQINVSTTLLCPANYCVQNLTMSTLILPKWSPVQCAVVVSCCARRSSILFLAQTNMFHIYLLNKTSTEYNTGKHKLCVHAMMRTINVHIKKSKIISRNVTSETHSLHINRIKNQKSFEMNLVNSLLS